MLLLAHVSEIYFTGQRAILISNNLLEELFTPRYNFILQELHEVPFGVPLWVLTLDEVVRVFFVLKARQVVVGMDAGGCQ